MKLVERIQRVCKAVKEKGGYFEEYQNISAALKVPKNTVELAAQPN